MAETVTKRKDTEDRFRELEIGEVLDKPHAQVINGSAHTTKKDGNWEGEIEPNPQCSGTVTVRGKVPGIENLSYLEAKCDACEFKSMEESIVFSHEVVPQDQ